MQETDEPEQPPVEVASPTLLGRLAHVLERSRLLRARLQELRSHSRLLDRTLQAVEHDSEIGGGILAGALAYRLFLFFLPLAFLLVAALGLVSRWFDARPLEVGRDVGLANLVTREVRDSARSGAGWWVALIALGALAYATSILYRAVAIVHSFAWQRSAAAAKAAPRSIKVFAFGIAAQLVLTAVAGPVRPPVGIKNILVLVAYLVGSGVIWLIVTLRLPHGTAVWQNLVPGAGLYAVGLLVVHVFNVYVLERLHDLRSSTYGSLGTAAALLLDFFILGRVIVLAAVLNATLFERRRSQ